MKNKNIWVISVAIALIILASFIFLRSNKVNPSVEAFLDEFYQHFNNKNYAYIYNALSDEELKESTSYLNFENSMKNVYGQFGEYKQRRIFFWNSANTVNGDYINLQYNTLHLISRAKESFTLKKKDDTWLLVYYNIKLDMGQ